MVSEKDGQLCLYSIWREKVYIMDSDFECSRLGKNPNYFPHAVKFSRTIIFLFYLGVSFDVRKLNVGDFLWIAREITLPLPGLSAILNRTDMPVNFVV